MNFQSIVKNIAKNLGVDIRAYHHSRSESARFGKLLNSFGIDLVFDVGANRGQYAEYLRFVGYNGRIVCFEPLTVPHAQLTMFAEKDSGITCAPRMAIGECDGEVSINVSANLESSSILKVMDRHLLAEPLVCPVGVETVVMHRLDTVAGTYLLDSTRQFLKIDVQGYEPQVLAGAAELLPRLTGLQLELSLVPLYEGERGFRDMIDVVEQDGFKLHDLASCYSDPITGRTYQVDALFFKS
jgi:FkbM family methyltransferase